MPKPTLDAGRLNRRVRIERPILSQSASGTTTTTWEFVAQAWASIEPLSVNAFLVAQSVKSKVSVRIMVRYQPGLTAKMRIVADDGTIYQPEGWMPDPNTGREWLTAPCKVAS